jgi:hypothetical protein
LDGSGGLAATTERGQKIVAGLQRLADESGAPSMDYYLPRAVVEAAAAAGGDESQPMAVSPRSSADEADVQALLSLRGALSPRGAA